MNSSHKGCSLYNPYTTLFTFNESKHSKKIEKRPICPQDKAPMLEFVSLYFIHLKVDITLSEGGLCY